LLFLLITILFVFNGYAQHFFENNFDKTKKYIILANPTIRNIKTIQYLTRQHLLDINKNKIKFVGVYYNEQNYDFVRTKIYIEKNNLRNFFLQEIKGKLNKKTIFRNNELSSLLKIIFNNSVGIFFFGGPDIPPTVYGEENTASVVTDPKRHYFETTFLFHLLGSSHNKNFVAYLNNRPNYMVTGFCLGMQTLNVATGGTLIQDIPSEVYGAQTPKEVIKLGRKNLHRNYWQKVVPDSLLMGANLHTIQFTDHPFFTKRVKAKKRWKPRIYSSHHQAVEKLGKGLQVTALSPDGKIIEGLAHKKYPHVFAVQFHPEVTALYEDVFVRKFTPEDKPMSYHKIIGKKSVKFHRKYWLFISNILRNTEE
jgi:putative glutamine amidotransferase